MKKSIEVEGYKLLSTEYINSSAKLEVQCPYGHVYLVAIGKFKLGRRCPYCTNRVKITKEEVEMHLKSEKYTLLSDFSNSNNRMLVLCPKGHEWEVTYQNFKNGNRCSKCSGKYRDNKSKVTKWDTYLVKAELQKYGYELLSEYVNNLTKIIIKCPQGHVTNKYFNHFLQGHLCKECSNFLRNEEIRLKHGEQFKKEAETDGYLLLEEYIGTHTPILMLCENHHYTERSYSNFKRRKDCKGCMMSSLEQVVYDILKKKHSNIIHEYVHPKMRDKRFDFAIMNSSFKKALFLIEVDGEQHYKDNRFGDNDSLTWNKRRDEEKDNFCLQENIPLLRIPYFKIEDYGWITEQLRVIKYGGKNN